VVQNKMVRVVVTQGYCLLRKALVERLEKEPWIEVCAVASGLEEALLLIDQHRPHVLLINISLKCRVGVSSVNKLKRDFSGLSVLAFSCDPELENAGADEYEASDDSLDNLVGAVRMVRDGFQAPAQPHIRFAQERILSRLSRREAEVFCFTGCGYVPQRVADKMGLSVKTVESYRERIRGKMNLLTGADLLYTSTSFMRSAARRGVDGSDEQVVKELLSATG